MIEARTEIFLEKNLKKSETIEMVDKWRFDLGLCADEINVEKPWGAYWKINKTQTGFFLNLFFPEMKNVLENEEQNLSPKFLLIAPGERISWQYHGRRAEEWKVVAGEVEVATSQTDEPDKKQTLQAGESVSLAMGERHRLIGIDGWGLVAEIWVHTNKDYPSDEEDVVRIQDDYGRKP
jgi:mannose-6-phosphate isomerase